MSHEKAIAYQHCLKVAKTHYENFPVVSLLLPKKQRKPIAVIYAFARTADDIADEGNDSAATRYKHLKQMEDKLRKVAQGEAVNDPVFIALADVQKTHHLPWQLFDNLLKAFMQDTQKKEYKNFHEITDYCKLSAEPIGQLLLHLNEQATPENIAQVNAVCRALQVINFLQDLSEDIQHRGRCYLPADEMQAFGLTPESLFDKANQEKVIALISRQIQRCQALLLQGKLLQPRLTGALKLQFKLTLICGHLMLEKLTKRAANINERPTLSAWERTEILMKSFFST